MELTSTPLLPDGFKVPASRNEEPSRRLRRLLATKPYVFGPGVYDPFGADQVMPKRCGHIAGKALISADEFVGKLKMMRNAADDLGHKDFVIIARTDGVSAT